MSNLISFQFKTSNIRIELKNNEPLFCLADVTDVLDIKNHRDLASKQLNSKGVEKIYTLTQGGKQERRFPRVAVRPTLFSSPPILACWRYLN
ncbi:Bro-N domain-containing protein [Snodgrassella communis]|uniref:BRO-N domain-containing protein n=1 Tax=Snodgrassella communis TaxID=2946699 RepID=UPI001EF42AE7|nr:hypothetical protein [Snodgrassella communis]